MSVNKEVIIDRISLYGNSFKRAGNIIATRYGINATGMDLLIIHALIATKLARLEYLANSPESPERDKALLDTQIDLDNYNWIADNYDEYLALVKRHCRS